MAGKGKTVAIDHIEPAEFSEIPGEFDDVTVFEDDFEEQLKKITSEFGGEDGIVELKLHVKRVLTGKGERASLFSCLPSELPILDRLRDDYGGGRFEIWIYKDGKLLKRPTVIIEAPKQNLVAKKQDDNTALILSGFEKLGELIAKGQQVARPVVDPMEAMTSMMTQMMAMKEFLGTGGAVQVAPVPVADPLAIVERVIAIQNTLGGVGGGEGATVSDVMLEIAKIFGKPIAELTMRAQAEHEGRVSGARTQPGTRKNGENAAGDDSGRQGVGNMRAQLLFLVGFAKKNLDPAPYAQMVIDHASDLDALLLFVAENDAIDKMVVMCPTIEPYREWFVELGQLILEFAKPDLTTDEDATTTGDNVPESPTSPDIDSPIVGSAAYNAPPGSEAPKD